jgi:hypothetical protein
MCSFSFCPFDFSKSSCCFCSDYHGFNTRLLFSRIEVCVCPPCMRSKAVKDSLRLVGIAIVVTPPSIDGIDLCHDICFGI